MSARAIKVMVSGEGVFRMLEAEHGFVDDEQFGSDFVGGANSSCVVEVVDPCFVRQCGFIKTRIYS